MQGEESRRSRHVYHNICLRFTIPKHSLLTYPTPKKPRIIFSLYIQPKNSSPAKTLRGNARRQLTSQKGRGQCKDVSITSMNTKVITVQSTFSGGANSQNTLGVRIQNAQKNQRNKRQQIQNQRRPGLQTVRVSICYHFSHIFLCQLGTTGAGFCCLQMMQLEVILPMAVYQFCQWKLHCEIYDKKKSFRAKQAIVLVKQLLRFSIGLATCHEKVPPTAESLAVDLWHFLFLNFVTCKGTATKKSRGQARRQQNASTTQNRKYNQQPRRQYG